MGHPRRCLGAYCRKLWRCDAGLLAAVLIATVLAAVHHAELVAHRVGEPFGTFLLAIAVTIIELGIITLMSAAPMPRAWRAIPVCKLMIILNGEQAVHFHRRDCP